MGIWDKVPQRRSSRYLARGQTPTAFERRCISAGPPRSALLLGPVALLPTLAYQPLRPADAPWRHSRGAASMLDRFASALLLGRMAPPCAPRSALPARRFVPLRARPGASSDRFAHTEWHSPDKCVESPMAESGHPEGPKRAALTGTVSWKCWRISSAGCPSRTPSRRRSGRCGRLAGGRQRGSGCQPPTSRVRARARASQRGRRPRRWPRRRRR